MVLTIWISCFIPKEIAGYTRPLPGDATKTMIPGPTPISDCFLTDQRSFSNSPTASSRMRSAVIIDASSWGASSTNHHCDNTVEVDCEDGSVECDQRPSAQDLK